VRATRSGTGVPDGGATGGPADPLAAAAGLRWSRPDLTAALADHVLETAAVTDDRDLWLRAAGWAVHARSATGDGRETAADVIDCLPDWGPESLGLAAAGRLRVELALVSVAIGRTDAAAVLLEPVAVDGVEVELRADALGVLARCAVEDDADRVEAVLEQAEDAWAAAGALHRDAGRASAALIGAAGYRRAGRPALAVDRAAAGLARLERGPDEVVGAGSGHLGAALAAEWILALLDAGRTDDAVRGCAQLLPRLGDFRPSRQLARLRLAVARTNAARSSAAETAQELGRAVRDAAECDAPDLEAVCCSALGSVYEKAGRPDVALTTVERGVAAQRVDRARATRLREALATLPMEVHAVDHGPTGRAAAPGGAPSRGGATSDPTRPALGAPPRRPGPVADVGGVHAATSIIPAVDPQGGPVEPVRPRRSRHGRAIDRAWQVGDFAPPTRPPGAPGPTPGRTNGATSGAANGSRLRAGSGAGVGPELDTDGRSPRGGAAGWDDGGDSPIGDLVMRSLRSGDGPGTPAAEHPVDEAGRGADRTPDAERRRVNGSARTGGRRRADDGDRPTAAPGGSPDLAGGGSAPGDADRSPGAGSDPDPSEPQGRRGVGPGEDPPQPAARRTTAEELEAQRSGAGRSWSASVVADWLAAELADMDRIWERINEPVVAATGSRPEPPGDQDRVVTIDIARDGRRQVGRRSAKLVRALADALGDHLPVGARIEQDEPCVLSVVLADAGPVTAQEWMHRSLDEVLDDDPAELRAPGLQLRAVERTADPTGPRFLRGLDGPDPSTAEESATEESAAETTAERSARESTTDRTGRRRRDDDEPSRPALPRQSRSDDPGGHRRDEASRPAREAEGRTDRRSRPDREPLPSAGRPEEPGRRRGGVDAGDPTQLLGRVPDGDGPAGAADSARRRSRSADPSGSSGPQGRRAAPDRDRAPATDGAGSDAPDRAVDRSPARSGRAGETPARSRRDLDALDSYRSGRPDRFGADRFGPGATGPGRSDPDRAEPPTGREPGGDRSAPSAPAPSGRRRSDRLRSARAASDSADGGRADGGRAEPGSVEADRPRPDPLGTPARPAAADRPATGRRRADRSADDPLDPDRSAAGPRGSGSPDRDGAEEPAAASRRSRPRPDPLDPDLLAADPLGLGPPGDDRPGSDPLGSDPLGSGLSVSGGPRDDRPGGSGGGRAATPSGKRRSRSEPPGPVRPDPEDRASRRNGSGRAGAGPPASTGPDRHLGVDDGRPEPPATGRRRADRAAAADTGHDPAATDQDRPARARHAGSDPATGTGDGASGPTPGAGPAPGDTRGNGTGRRRIDASTEGLGLADLLAGALAEYRGI
jgi:hypothetical protein